MKRPILLATFLATCTLSFGQAQIGNGDMEIWEGIGSATEEPENWSGIKTASGDQLLIAFAPQALFQSTDTPSGSGFSAMLETQSALGIPANGTMTCGSLNVGSATASDPSNYAWSDIAGTENSEACADMPDSIVFWAKAEIADAGHNARMKATLHDNYEYRDPEDAAASGHVVASAVLNFPATNGWVRMSAPFDYSGPASGNTHILVTFTTNQTPGVGTIGDRLYIDDVELIYNGGGSSSIEEKEFAYEVNMNNTTDEIQFIGEAVQGEFVVLNMSGQKVLSGDVESTVSFDAPSGVYIIQVKVDNQLKQFKVYKN